jgi:predicted MFS family arabinose efflux permease
MGTGLGLAVGYPLVGYLLTQFAWDTSFHVLGVMNIALGIPLVLAFVRMPPTHADGAKPRLSARRWRAWPASRGVRCTRGTCS